MTDREYGPLNGDPETADDILYLRGWSGPPPLPDREFHALVAAEAASRALDTHVGGERLTLRGVIDSPLYPFEAGSVPDRFVRRLAEVVPDYMAAADSPETTDSSDVNLAIESADGRCMAINGSSHTDYFLDGAWQVLAWGQVDIMLFLPDDADEAAFFEVIRLLRAHGVLPGSLDFCEEALPDVGDDEERPL